MPRLPRELDKTHPGTAASLRKGTAKTLTIPRLGLPPTLTPHALHRQPNRVDTEICREHSKNVKR